MRSRDIYAIALVLPGLAQALIPCEAPPGPPARLTPSEVALSVDEAALERQYRALSAMPSIKVTYSDLGLIRLIEGDTGIVLSNQAHALREGESGAEVLEKFRDVLLASGEETLTVRLNMSRVVKLDQAIRGIPVLHGGVSITIDGATGVVRNMGAYFLPDHGLPREPKLNSTEAIALAKEMLEKQGTAKPGTVEASDAPTLAYHGIFPGSTRGRLVWAVIARYLAADVGDPGDGIYWIDAIDGEYVGMEPYSVAANRTVPTANDGTRDLVVSPFCTRRR